MARTSSRDLVKQIGQALSTKPQTVTEISDSIDREPNHVGAWLRALKAGGFIEGRKEGAKKLYWLPDDVVLEVVEEEEK